MVLASTSGCGALETAPGMGGVQQTESHPGMPQQKHNVARDAAAIAA